MPQSETLNMIIENMESVIVGKRKAIELALITLLSDGHLLLEDVPGGRQDNAWESPCPVYPVQLCKNPVYP